MELLASAILVASVLWKLRASELNNTVKAEANFVFFSRVPRAGGENFLKLMETLSGLNHFKVFREEDNPTINAFINEETQEALLSTLLDVKQPFVYSQRVNFIDFKQFDMPQPIYISLVREPVTRVISWYYHVRDSAYIVESQMMNPYFKIQRPNFLRRSFDECVQTHQDDCNFDQMSIIPNQDIQRQMSFFCGHDKQECYPFNSPAALQIAKRNVEEEYAVVGTWEEPNITLTVLEHYMPGYFKGIATLYNLYSSSFTDTYGKLKPYVSKEVQDMVTKNFTNEIEFYEFCKQRLYKQYLAIPRVGAELGLDWTL